jgi:TolB protein
MRLGGKKLAKTKNVGVLAAAAGALVAVALLALMLVLVEPRPAEATFPGINGKIVYRAHDGNDYELYTINARGRGKVKLTKNSTTDIRPDWSPDAKRIAYSGSDGQDFEIYTINADGSELDPVTDNDTHDLTPSYNPNGTRIAYSGFDGSDQEIFVTDTSGEEPRFRVTNTSTSVFDPDWSPDGQRIAFEGLDAAASDDQRDYEIYTINVDGTGLDQVTINKGSKVSPPPDDQDPSYHPTGERIALSRTGPSSQISQIFTAHVKFANEFPVTTTSSVSNNFRPDYSPNGQKIAFEGYDGNDYEIYTINVDGTDLFQVTNNSGNDFDPSWGRNPLLERLKDLPPSQQ